MQADRPSVRRIMIATLMGQVTEWYDYAIYALVAVQVGRAFFPSEDEATSLLASLAVFGLAFLSRPLGGMLIGRIGDRSGRRSVLVLSLLLMTGATTLMGLLPGAATLGLAAPVLLMALRFVQGLSAAGEATSAITFVAESVPRHRRGLYVATLFSGSAGGYMLANIVAWALREGLGDAAFDQWGWRLGFLFALPLGLTGLYIRRQLAETPVFEQLREAGELSPTPLRDSLTGGIGQVLQAVGIAASTFVANYLLVAYMPIHLGLVGASPRMASAISVVTTATLVLSYPLLGLLSDHVGRRPMMFAGNIALLLLAWPLFSLTTSNDTQLALLGVVPLAMATATIIACLGLYCTEFIDRSRLMTTFSVGFNVAAAIFGGSSLWAFGWLGQVSGDLRMPAAYVVVSAAISLIALVTIRPARASSVRP